MRRWSTRGIVPFLLTAVLSTAGLLASVSCADDDAPAATADELDSLLAIDLGGEGSTSSRNQNAFSLPNRALPGSLRGEFEVGDSFFTQKWVRAPASTDVRDGLGPLFNAEACASCHVLDGRGTPPTEEHPDAPGLLFRLSLVDGDGPGDPGPDPILGGQLQDRALDGVPVEGRMGITYEEVEGHYDDGEPYTLLDPTYTVTEPAHGPVPDDLLISPRLAPPTIGIGLLEAVPEKTVVAAADPDDEDGDNISGRPNRIENSITGELVLGRFGWKANAATAEQQTVSAFHGDIGITSPLIEGQDCTEVQQACADAIDGGEPEIDDDTLASVVFYTRVLAVPKRRPAEGAAGRERQRRGAAQFAAANCSGCHTPELRTGPSDVRALGNQTIHPFTDLLLHDMGPGLADGRRDADANGSEWRTAPLWGIGLTETINGNTRYLHDGRARSLEEAILWHGGEAGRSRDAFKAMSAGQRRDLVAYLETL